MAQTGHELANHSYSHRWMIGSTEAHYRVEIGLTDALLRRAGATDPRLFRPPFGKRLIGLPRAVASSGYRMVTWDIEDDAVRHPTPQTLAEDIVGRARPGSIILIHPMYRANELQRRALPLVLDGLAKKGLRVVTIGELLRLDSSD